VDFDRSGNFFLYADENAFDYPSASDFLQVLKTFTYYNFQENTSVGHRTITIETVDGEGLSSFSVAMLLVTDRICASFDAIDVVFVLDSSSSWGLSNWNVVKAFTSRVTALLPTSESGIRFVCSFLLLILTIVVWHWLRSHRYPLCVFR
jgi:hypothetical protein